MSPSPVKDVDSESVDSGLIDEWGVGEAPSRVVVNQEFPPSRLAVLIRDKDDDLIGRHAEDEAKVENLLQNLTKTGDMPGGDGELSYSLARDPKQSWADIPLYSKIELQGAGGERLWTGTIWQKPEQDGERQAIEVKALGDKQFLEDDEEAIGPGFIDSDMSKWTDPSTDRKLALGASIRLDGSVSQGWQGTGATAPGISIDFRGVSTGAGKEDRGESWYYGGGVPIGKLLYHFVRLLGGSGSEWTTDGALFNDDHSSEGALVGVDHHAATNSDEFETVEATDDSKLYARFVSGRSESGGGGAELGDLHLWQLPKILGRQGLQLQGEWPNVGFLAKQMIPFIAEIAGLTTIDELLEDDGFIIPQAWFSEPGLPMMKLVEVTKYGLLDWFVFGGRVLQYRFPGTYGRKWRLSPGSAPKNSGADASRVFEALMVTWQDVDGTTRKAGPPGSGAEIETSRLQITDERNPAVAAGRRRRKLLALNGVCVESIAIRTGERFLEEVQNLAQSGETTITGYCQDQYGTWLPASYVQPGDEVTPAGATRYRRITNASYGHDGKSVGVTLDAPKDGYEALEARFNARLLELGIS